MKGKLPNKARLEHIRDASETIDSFIIGQTFDDFALDIRMTCAVVKALEIVGEAAYHVTNDVRELDNTTDSGAIVALRHILIHEYYGIRPEILWRIIRVHTTDLKPKVQNGPPMRLINELTEAQPND